MSQEYGAPPQQKKSGMPVWAWCLILPFGCLVVVVPILAGILFPVFAQARESARSVSCLSNIKQQSLGMLMYAQDYDEKLPAATAWMDMTEPYVKSEMTLHCPTVTKPGSETYGYAYNSKLSRLALEKVAAPQTMSLIYDSTNLSRHASDAVSSLPSPPRHRRHSNNMSYVDGHARALVPAGSSE